MQRVIAYGIGRIYKKSEKLIRDKYDVIGLMDKSAVTGTFYNGIPYLDTTRLGEMEYDGILVTALYSRMDIENDIRHLRGRIAKSYFTLTRILRTELRWKSD